MKKALLLGDSIRMGYDEFVRDLLKDECEVFYDDNDNGRFAAYTLWQANQFFKNAGRFDVVHWNNGYWDSNVEFPMLEAMHPIDEYLHFLKRIIGEIRRNGAEIIFATSVPFLNKEGNDRIVAYNEAAKKLMADENILVNDLYNLMLQGKNFYKCEDMVHLTEEGYKVCANQTALMIREKLQARNNGPLTSL